MQLNYGSWTTASIILLCHNFPVHYWSWVYVSVALFLPSEFGSISPTGVPKHSIKQTGRAWTGWELTAAVEVDIRPVATRLGWSCVKRLSTIPFKPENAFDYPPSINQFVYMSLAIISYDDTMRDADNFLFHSGTITNCNWHPTCYCTCDPKVIFSFNGIWKKFQANAEIHQISNYLLCIYNLTVRFNTN